MRDRVRLAGFGGCIALLHLLGWGGYLVYSQRFSSLVGLGLVAYLLGMRHAFDADHITAIDDIARLMREAGRRPLGLGFFSHWAIRAWYCCRAWCSPAQPS